METSSSCHDTGAHVWRAHSEHSEHCWNCGVSRDIATDRQDGRLDNKRSSNSARHNPVQATIDGIVAKVIASGARPMFVTGSEWGQSPIDLLHKAWMVSRINLKPPDHAPDDACPENHGPGWCSSCLPDLEHPDSVDARKGHVTLKPGETYTTPWITFTRSEDINRFMVDLWAYPDIGAEGHVTSGHRPTWPCTPPSGERLR